MRRVLQIRQYGGSKTPAKFARMLDQQVDGVLYGQYVFNGAAQTGRASSKGVQIHNLARDTIKGEADAIEHIYSGCSYDYLAAGWRSDHPGRPHPVAAVPADLRRRSRQCFCLVGLEPDRGPRVAMAV